VGRIEQEKSLDQLYTIRSLGRSTAQCEQEEVDVDKDEEQERFDLAFYKEGPLGVILIECYHPRYVLLLRH
jgi:hypothetical protein